MRCIITVIPEASMSFHHVLGQPSNPMYTFLRQMTAYSRRLRQHLFECNFFQGASKRMCLLGYPALP